MDEGTYAPKFNCYCMPLLKSQEDKKGLVIHLHVRHFKMSKEVQICGSNEYPRSYFGLKIRKVDISL